jgi:hypothetical protein
VNVNNSCYKNLQSGDHKKRMSSRIEMQSKGRHRIEIQAFATIPAKWREGRFDAGQCHSVGENRRLQFTASDSRVGGEDHFACRPPPPPPVVV